MNQNPDNRIDEDFIRETVKEYMSLYNVSNAQLGRILGYKGENASNLSNGGKRFLENSDRKTTLQEVGVLASYMRVPVMSLLRPVESGIPVSFLIYMEIKTSSNTEIIPRPQLPRQMILQTLLLL